MGRAGRGQGIKRGELRGEGGTRNETETGVKNVENELQMGIENNNKK